MSLFVLKETCRACPEQYDVFYDDQEVGYMRLRHGTFRAEYRGEVVYAANTKGDGRFHDDEREHYLNEACRAIRQKMLGDVPERMYVIDPMKNYDDDLEQTSEDGWL